MAGRRRPIPSAARLAVAVSLLAACQAAPDAPTGDSDPAGDRPGPGAIEAAALPRINPGGQPWGLLADPGGLWVVVGDDTVARYDTGTLRRDGAPVRLPFRAGAMALGHGDLWVGGQVDGRRRVTAEGSYPVIQVARVDPGRRAVTKVIALPLRSNANRLVSTVNAVWVTDPAEGRLSRTWRIDPATNRPLRPPLRAGEEPVAMEVAGGSVWSAGHDDGTLRRLDAGTGALQDRIDLGFEPHGMAVAPGAVWVADAHHRALLRVDPGSGRAVARLDLGFEPGPVVATRTAVWVASPPDPDLAGATLARIDPARNRVTATAAVPGMVTALAGDQAQAWVATTGPDAVRRLPA